MPDLKEEVPVRSEEKQVTGSHREWRVQLPACGGRRDPSELMAPPTHGSMELRAPYALELAAST
jgi:hypothetical protein